LLPVRALNSTVRHGVPIVPGLTQADMVIPVVASSEFESGTST
jgi:hypothetical protein